MARPQILAAALAPGTLSSSQCLRRFGEPTAANEPKYMSVWNVPADIQSAFAHVFTIGKPGFPKKIYGNKLLIPRLECGLRNVMERGLARELKTWDGCHNVRLQRGYTSMSLHAWGAAFDVNAAENGLGKKPRLTPAFVKCFTDAGLEWGGSWQSRPDGMHFQLDTLNPVSGV